MPNLLNRIKNKTAKVVVVGVGYVGLPVVALCAKAGFSATGVDVNENRIKLLNKGGNPIEGKEPGLDALLKQARRTGRLDFVSSPEVYKDADIIIIAVETPVDDGDHKPRYVALRSAIESIAQQVEGRKLKVEGRELMVVVESTIAPGTIDGVVRPLLEKSTGRKEGRDLYVVNCPERLMPGQLIKKIQHHSRVIGASSSKSTNIAKTFYRNIIVHQPKHPDFQWRGELDTSTNMEAEIVKTAENAYRDVQIAFANELAWLCEEYGADFWRVRELIRKSPRRDVHEAGAGVGGHCIPKDSWLLLSGLTEYCSNLKGESYKGNSSRLRSNNSYSVIAGARHLNDHAPKHMFDVIKAVAKQNSIDLTRTRIAIMGYSYLADSDDTRNSPTQVLVEHLDKAGIKYKIHDPFVKEYKKTTISKILDGSNMAIFMVAHGEYRLLKPSSLAKFMKKSKIIIDGRNIFKRRDVESEGMVYYGIGDIKKQDTRNPSTLLGAGKKQTNSKLIYSN